MLSINIDPSSILAIVLTLGSLAYWYWRLCLRSRLENKKPFEELPMPPNSHWLVGHWGQERGQGPQKMGLMLKSSDEKGRLGYWNYSRPTLFVSGWEDVRAVLQSEFNREKPNFIIEKHLSRTTGHKRILFLKGKEWKNQRSALNKSFTPAAMNSSKDAIVQVTQTVASSLKKEIKQQGYYECEIETLMKMITLDVFGLALFSCRFGSCDTLTPAEIVNAFDVITSDGSYRIKDPIKPTNFFHGIPTERNRKYVAARETIRSFVSGALMERLDPDSKQQKNDVLNHLIRGSESLKDGNITLDDLVSLTIGVLFAGYDTTSVTLSYALYLLSQHPEVEANCVAEIKALGGKVDDAEELEYCKAVVNETLRLFPPAYTNMRSLQKDIKLPSGFVVPAGTEVKIPTWFVHRSEANFPRADEFLPERWVKKDGDGASWVEREPSDTDSSSSCGVPPANRKALFAFSFGGRNCAGEKFAREEAVLVLAGLVKDFRFSALPDYQLTPQWDPLIQHPHDKLPMKITLRE